MNKTKLKILYVLNSKTPGGMEQHVLDLVKGMLGLNHQVFVWCPQGAPFTWYQQAGAQVFEKEIKSDIDRSYILDLEHFLTENSIDVVHAHELKAVTNTLLAAKQAKTPVKISHTHTPISEWQIPKMKKLLNVFGYSYLVNHYADAEIALTDSKKNVKIGEGIKPQKLEVIPNGIDTKKFTITQTQKNDSSEEIKKRFNIPKNAFIFGNVSRLSKEKGHQTLINAFSLFLRSDIYHSQDFRLLIAGGGELEQPLRELIKKHGIENKVIITGVFEPEDLVKFYSTFDFFVFPSLAEGFGYVLLEALYMRLPIICSDLPVLQEIADDTVSYFAVGDYLNLSEKMMDDYSKYILNEETHPFDGHNMVEQKYTLDAFVENYDSLYKRLEAKK